MGPFTPQTPGTSYSPYAQPSPSPGSYSGNLHLYTCISDLLKSSLCQDGCWIKMTTILEDGCLKRKIHSLDLQHGHRQAVSTCTSKLGQWKTIYIEMLFIHSSKSRFWGCFTQSPWISAISLKHHPLTSWLQSNDSWWGTFHPRDWDGPKYGWLAHHWNRGQDQRNTRWPQADTPDRHNTQCYREYKPINRTVCSIWTWWTVHTCIFHFNFTANAMLLLLDVKSYFYIYLVQW